METVSRKMEFQYDSRLLQMLKKNSPHKVHKRKNEEENEGEDYDQEEDYDEEEEEEYYNEDDDEDDDDYDDDDSTAGLRRKGQQAPGVLRSGRRGFTSEKDAACHCQISESRVAVRLDFPAGSGGSRLPEFAATAFPAFS
ncbi:hypothetical protein PR048_021762 [Dryococelus australis]|uniref:Uncharacterized protein n=1 Tax=Dryococelus australis TaxID=614101 RepID=A0ABQ9GZ49_9NEOP|nr:hypothetical protein PR048_021762 [Dryococelus australis]